MSVVLPDAPPPADTPLLRQKQSGPNGFWRTTRLTPGERELMKSKPNERQKPYNSCVKQKIQPNDDSYLQDEAESLYLKQLQNVLEYMKKQTQEENKKCLRVETPEDRSTQPTRQLSTSNGQHLGYRYRSKHSSSHNIYISTLAPSVVPDRLPGETTTPEPLQFRLQTLNSIQKSSKPRFQSARNLSASTCSLAQRSKASAASSSARADYRRNQSVTGVSCDRRTPHRSKLLKGRSSCRIECGSPCDTDSDFDADEIRLLSYTAQSQNSSVSSVFSLPSVQSKLPKSPLRLRAPSVKRDSKATDTADLPQLQPKPKTEEVPIIPRRVRGRTEIQPADEDSPTRLLVYIPN